MLNRVVGVEGKRGRTTTERSCLGTFGAVPIATAHQNLTPFLLSSLTVPKGFALANGAGLPFIMIIFVLEVKSAILLLIPLATTLGSLVVAYGLGLGIAAVPHVHIPNYVPQIMLFLCLALSIDYSFFLLTRFQQERARAPGPAWNAPAATMLSQSGRIIVVSGAILSLTWFALGFFPVFGLDAVGYCSGVTVLVCIAFNLLATPALLVAFPGLFSRKCRVPCARADPGCGGAVAPGDATAPGPALADSDEEDAVEDGTATAALTGGWNGRGWYYRLGLWLTAPPGNVVVPVASLAVLVGLCLALHGLQFILAASVDFGSSPEADAFGRVSRDFPLLRFTSPFAVLGVVVEPDPGGVRSEAFFAAQCRAARALSGVPGVVASSISGAAVAGGRCIDHTEAVRWLNVASCATDPQPLACAQYRYNFAQTVNPRSSAAVLAFATTFNPFSTRSRALTSDVRAALATLAPSAAARFHFYHPIVTEVDAEKFTESRFPFVFAGTLLAAFVLIALRFRAAVVPLKLGLTIVVPILALFGLAVGVYRDGWLDWTHIAPLMGTGGMSWLLPVGTILLLVGLALDYDIFLFSYVYELRQSGRYSTQVLPVLTPLHPQQWRTGPSGAAPSVIDFFMCPAPCWPPLHGQNQPAGTWQRPRKALTSRIASSCLTNVYIL